MGRKPLDNPTPAQLHHRLYMRQFYIDNPDQRIASAARIKRAYWDGPGRDRILRKRYGISLAGYNAVLAEQDGKCAICRTEKSKDARRRNLCVDHDHETGKVRGILCTQCNRALGLLEDSPELLKRALMYLTGMSY